MIDVKTVQLARPRLAPLDGGNPTLYSSGEWFGNLALSGSRSQIIIPRDKAKDTKVLAIGSDSAVGKFSVASNSGSGRVLTLTRENPLVGRLTDLLDSQDADVTVYADDWHTKTQTTTIRGVSTLNRSLVSAQVVAYNDFPPWLPACRGRLVGSSRDVGDSLAVFATAAESVVALIPCSGRAWCSLALQNKGPNPTEWRVEGISYGPSGFGPQFPAVDPYPSGVNTIGAATSNDGRYLPNLGGLKFLRIWGRPTVADDAYGSLDIVWELGDSDD